MKYVILARMRSGRLTAMGYRYDSDDLLFELATRQEAEAWIGSSARPDASADGIIDFQIVELSI